LPTFRKLFEKIRGMPEQQGSPEQNVPQLWDEIKALSPVSAAVHKLLLIQAFRPALVTLLLQSIYGAKIDNDFDQRLLTSFVRNAASRDFFGSCSRTRHSSLFLEATAEARH